MIAALKSHPPCKTREAAEPQFGNRDGLRQSEKNISNMSSRVCGEKCQEKPIAKRLRKIFWSFAGICDFEATPDFPAPPGSSAGGLS